MKTKTETNNHRVSIIIPAWNVASTLRQVLEPLLPLPEGWNILVVDDGSTDKTVEIARQMGVTVIPSDGRRSDLAARNTGVRATKGEILIFLDADVLTNINDLTDSVSRLLEGSRTCLFGVYNRGQHLGNTVSRYKNYWIRHSTLNASKPLRWLNSSLIIIRRSSFLEIDGFRELFTCTHGGGDLDFGRRIAENGGSVEVDPMLQVSHLKQFSLHKLWINDYQRAQGWLRHALEFNGLKSVIAKPSLANVSPGFSWGVVAAALAILSATLSPFDALFLLLAAFLLLLAILLNYRFIRDAVHEKVRGAPLFIPLLWFDQIACATGLLAAVTGLMLQKILGRGFAASRAPHQ